jgi:hypothetical protein
MKRTPTRRRTRLRAKKQLRRSKPLQRTTSMAASERQRAAVVGRRCIVCAAETRIDPAHVIPRSLGGCGDLLCVVPLCRRCHRTYDRGGLDLLPYLVSGSDLTGGWRWRGGGTIRHIGLAIRRPVDV